jgi:hypothetical protein
MIRYNRLRSYRHCDAAYLGSHHQQDNSLRFLENQLVQVPMIAFHYYIPCLYRATELQSQMIPQLAAQKIHLVHSSSIILPEAGISTGWRISRPSSSFLSHSFASCCAYSCCFAARRLRTKKRTTEARIKKPLIATVIAMPAVAPTERPLVGAEDGVMVTVGLA